MRITVIGATGAQGGSVVNALLDDTWYDVRAVTRRPDSEAADALRARGVEVVAADLDDPDSLVKAFDGAQAAYCVTNFWEHQDPDKETQQGRNLAEAVARAGVDHTIWSTLDDTRLTIPLDDDEIPTLLGRYKVPHIDAKADADRFFDADRTTFLVLPYYWDNLKDPRSLYRDEAGRLIFPLPLGDAKLPGIAVSDIGRIARAILDNHLTGERIRVSGDQLTAVQMAEALTNALGEPVQYLDLPLDTLRGWGFIGEDGANTMLFKRLFNPDYCATRTPEATRALLPETLNFTSWLEQTTLMP